MGISAYSMVALPDGGSVRAEDIVAGDVLLNPLGGTVTTKKVWQGPGVGMFRIGTGEALVDLTGDQKVRTRSGPLAAGEVRPGTVLVTASGEATCSEAGGIMGDYMVYDIVPENNAGSWLSVNGFFVGLD